MRPKEDRETKIKWLKRYRVYRDIHRIFSNEYFYWNDTYDTYEEAGKKFDQWLAAMTGAKEASVCFSDWADKTACVCAEIYSAIMSLEAEETLIMSLRYIEGLPWDVISSKCNLSQRQIFRIHQKALDHINMSEARRKPPSLMYASDFMFNYASTTNVVGGEGMDTPVFKPNPDDVFAD